MRESFSVKWKTEDPKETERVRKGDCERKRVGKRKDQKIVKKERYERRDNLNEKHRK